MILIMIKLKEYIPTQVNEAIQDQLYHLQDASNTPKENELLLRLFISSLPRSTVFHQIQNSSSLCLPLIYSLRYIPISTLIDEYICVENGLLHNRSNLVLPAIMELIEMIAEKSKPYQRRHIIFTIFQELTENADGSNFFLKTLGNLLNNTFYIVSSKEIQLLLQLYKIDNYKENLRNVFYSCIFQSIDDIKVVSEYCCDLDVSKYVYVLFIDV